MIRKLVAGASLAGLLTLGVGTALQTANAQDPGGKQEQQEKQAGEHAALMFARGGEVSTLKFRR